MSHGFATSLELFFGDANPAETRVYARYGPGPNSLKDELQGLQLAGTLRGPFCKYAQTLPATIPLVPLGPGKTLLAQVVVPDPCFWTPELPFLYQAQIELRRGRNVLDVVECPLGIRPLGARRRRFYYEGKPWVLRGVCQPSAQTEELRDYRAAAAAMLADNPDEELCAAASEQGVLIVANLQGDASTMRERIRCLARHAAVGLIVIAEELPVDLDPRAMAPNVLFVQRLDHVSQSPQRWSHAWLCRLDGAAASLEPVANAALPVIAWRPEPRPASVAQRRALCDALQRDLAGRSEIAGYVV